MLAAPAAAHPNMSVTFEAPRDLLDPATRDSALAELDTLGVRSLRIVLYWKDVAPDPNGGRPQLDETDPANYDWSKYDPLIDAANARGWPVLLTVSGPVPRWATRAGRDFVTRPSPARFQAVHDRGGPPLRRQGRDLVDLERAEPAALPAPAVRRRRARPRPPGLYRKLYDAGRARPHRGRARRRPDALRRAGPARDRQRRRAAHVPARDALPGRELQEARQGLRRLDTTGMAHHAYTTREGPWFVPAGPTT